MKILIPILISLNTAAFLITAYLRVGLKPSISRYFYSNTLRKWFKSFLWANGSMVVLYDLGNLTLTIAGLSLIAVPIFADFLRSPTRYFHFFFAGLFYAATSWYIGWWYTATIALAFVLGHSKLNLSIYWLEVLGIVALILGLLLHG